MAVTPSARSAALVSGGLQASGPVWTAAPEQRLRYRNLPVALPVYPDGPVQLSLPVRQASSAPVRVTVGFAACSSRLCLPPVRRHVLQLG